MKTASTGEGHIDLGDLVRYLDGEMSVAERASTAEHLLQCPECAADLDTIRAERQLLADVLNQFDVPEIGARRREQSWAAIEKAAVRPAVVRPAAAQRPARRGVGLAAAAVAATVLVTTFSVSPVRAFVADLWSNVASRTGLVRTTVLEPAPIRVAGATIGFVPTVDSFLLDVRTTQREGSLILAVNEGASVNARAEGGDEVVDIVILPESGMRIENDADEMGA